MDILGLIVIFVASAVGSFYATSTGGGGLLRIPVMLFLGLPLHVAIATNKLSAFGVSVAGLYKFAKSKKINYKVGLFLAIFTSIGSVIGANILLTIDKNLLNNIVAVFLVLILFVVLFKNKLGVKKSSSKLKKRSWFLGSISGFVLGIYSGFLFATGIIASFLLLTLFKHTYLESAGTRKIVLLPSVIISLVIFILAGVIDWAVGIPLFLGSIIGSYVGTAHAIKKGDAWVKRMLMIVIIGMIIKLLFF